MAGRGVVFGPFQPLQSHNKASNPCLSCVRNMLLMLRFRTPASIQRQQEKSQANTCFSIYSVFPWTGRWKFETPFTGEVTLGLGCMPELSPAGLYAGSLLCGLSQQPLDACRAARPALAHGPCPTPHPGFLSWSSQLMA